MSRLVSPPRASQRGGGASRVLLGVAGRPGADFPRRDARIRVAVGTRTEVRFAAMLHTVIALALGLGAPAAAPAAEEAPGEWWSTGTTG